MGTHCLSMHVTVNPSFLPQLFSHNSNWIFNIVTAKFLLKIAWGSCVCFFILVGMRLVASLTMLQHSGFLYEIKCAPKKNILIPQPPPQKKKSSWLERWVHRRWLESAAAKMHRLSNHMALTAPSTTKRSSWTHLANLPTVYHLMKKLG